MSTETDNRSIGSKVVDRLKGFVDAVEAGNASSRQFTSRTMCLNIEPNAYDPELVRSTRKVLGMSQSVFGKFLGESASAVQDWEQGKKPPKGSACRLMDEIRRDPDYWRDRLRELASPVSA